MKLIVFFLYGLLLLVGAYLLTGREPPNTLVATKALPRNHLLQPGDVTLKVDEGRYITRAVGAGEVVKQTDIAPRPDTSLPRDHVPLAIDVAHLLVMNGAIDAGTKGLVCPPDIAVTVQAVYCGATSAACIAIVAVPADKSGEVSGKPGLSLATGQKCE